jgi:hypothetical protein
MKFMLLVAASMILSPLVAVPARGDDAEAVKALIERWYAELRKNRMGGQSRYWTLLAPGSIVEPSRRCYDPNKPQPRVLKLGETAFYGFLAIRAQKFAHEIESMQVDRTLARIQVWERGWIYAGATKTTYENAAGGTFILVKKEGEDWKILVYESRSSAVRAQDRDGPMPDLTPENGLPVIE